MHMQWKISWQLTKSFLVTQSSLSWNKTIFENYSKMWSDSNFSVTSTEQEFLLSDCVFKCNCLILVNPLYKDRYSFLDSFRKLEAFCDTLSPLLLLPWYLQTCLWVNFFGSCVFNQNIAQSFMWHVIRKSRIKQRILLKLS